MEPFHLYVFKAHNEGRIYLLPQRLFISRISLNQVGFLKRPQLFSGFVSIQRQTRLVHFPSS